MVCDPILPCMSPFPVDVLVVGAGPAGLSAARAAAAAGCRTVVLEKNREIGRPVRTSGGSWLRDVDELGIPRALAHPVERVRFLAPGREAAWSYPDPVFCVLDVTGAYVHLADQAACKGAEVRLEHTVSGPLVEDGRVAGVEVRLPGGRVQQIRAGVTIDASGFSGLLARKVGLRGAFGRVGIGIEHELLAPSYDQREAVLCVGRQVADRGYGWIFPHGDGHVRVGVGVLRPDSAVDPRALLGRLMTSDSLAEGLRGATVVESHTGVIPGEPLRQALSAPGLILAGDSASQASPLVGEGIRYAIRAGRLAGEVAAGALKAGDTSARALGTYDRAWHRQFGREMAVSDWLNRRFARYGDRNWRVVAALLGELSGDQLAQGLRGDYSTAWVAGLLVRAPRLAQAAWGVLRAGH